MKKEAKSEQETSEENGYVKWLFELSNKDVSIAGGKGASLAEMFNNKFPVPPAFIITAQAFGKFIERIKEEIDKIIEKTEIENTKELNEASKKIRELIEKQSLPLEMEREILEAYEILGTEKKDAQIGENALNILKIAKEPVFVAVRSSATTEDLASASFAGQQESFLGIKGKTQLLDAIKKCSSSLYTPRAIYYREKKGFKHAHALLAVVVQKMINSEKSGVIFTKNPIHLDENIVIEAVFGLGEGIVSGKIKPDNYLVSKELEILEKKIADKKIALVRAGSGSIEEVKLTEQRSNQQVLTDGEIQRLADIAMSIEKHYKKPQDIEFAIEDHALYIVQSRPITTSAKKTGKELEGKVLLQGSGASPGIASGKVRIVKIMNDLEKVKKGDILVTEMTNPDMVVTMQKSSAIITDEGGATSHAAIVSREMGIACVVGTKNATSLLKDGQIVTVDGSNGKVYEGKVGEEKKEEILPAVETKTKIKVILDLPDYAERAAQTGCKAVGLLRLEGIIAESGKHPLMFLAENRINDYSKIIERGTEKIAKHFESVWIRTSDIRTDEFRHLEGSPQQIELNPMLGFHGIRFSLKNKAILEAELQAAKRVAEKFPDKKIGVMFPQIISVEEVKEAKKLFEKFKKENMQFGIMVETPAACQIIEELCKLGLDFISFGTNDLTQFTLAVDRGNENVQFLYNEMHLAVLREIESVIKVCKENNVETSICGQAASKPEMAKFLVEKGIDSISVNADAAYEISKVVQEIEQRVDKPIEEPLITESSEIKTEVEEEKIKEAFEEEKRSFLERKTSEGEENEKGKEETKEKSEEYKEFPDTEIGFDVFSSKLMVAGAPIEQKEVRGSIATKPEREKKEKKKEEYPLLDMNLDFLNMPISGAIVKKEENEKTSEKEDKKDLEEDEDLKEAIEEMQGKADEEDIDIPEEKDENVLDIF